MDFPHYCESMIIARMCADQIADSHCLLGEEIVEENQNTITLIYKNEEIRMVIKIFIDNWYRRQKCYSFRLLSLERLDGTAKEELPYQRIVGGHLQRQVWRKIPSYFASDIAKSIGALRSADQYGRVRGTIIKLVGGYGFARTAYIPKVFVWLKDIHEDVRDFVELGTELTFKVVSERKGPRAADIEVVGQKELFEAIALAEQEDDNIELMKMYKNNQYVTDLIEYQLKRAKHENDHVTKMSAALRKALTGKGMG